MQKVEKSALEWVIRGCQNKKGFNDPYMLRIELLDLKQSIEQVLEREKEKDTEFT
jgi:hypothetical protein